MREAEAPYAVVNVDVPLLSYLNSQAICVKNCPKNDEVERTHDKMREREKGGNEGPRIGWITHDCQKGSEDPPSIHAPVGEYSIRGLTLSNVTFTL